MRPGDGDGLPWYRHFWPWFIVGLLGTAMIASIATVVIAVRVRDPVVETSWYRDGVAINERIEQRAAADRLGVRAELELPTGAGPVVVTLRARASLSGDTLSLALRHATDEAKDRALILARVGPDRYEGRLSGPALAGRYYATLEPTKIDRAPGAVLWQSSRAFYAHAGANRRIVFDGGG